MKLEACFVSLGVFAIGPFVLSLAADEFRSDVGHVVVTQGDGDLDAVSEEAADVTLIREDEEQKNPSQNGGAPAEEPSPDNLLLASFDMDEAALGNSTPITTGALADEMDDESFVRKLEQELNLT